MKRQPVGWDKIFGGSTAVAVTWLIGYYESEIPFWPFVVFATVAVVSLYGWLGSRYGLPPFKLELPQISEEHAAQLRDVAKRLRIEVDQNKDPTSYSPDLQGRDFWEAVFRAHFPGLHQQLDIFSERYWDWSKAESRYRDEASGPIVEGFREIDGWDRDGLRARFEANFWGIAQSDPFHPELEDHLDGSVTWDRAVIFRSNQRDGAERLLAVTQAEMAVREWVNLAKGSEQAEVVVRSRAALNECGSVVLAAIEPIIQGQTIHAAKDCAICDPKSRAHGPDLPRRA